MEKWSKDSLILQRRNGTSSPYIDINESLKIDGTNRVNLRELPSKYHGVSVTGDGKNWLEVEKAIETNTEFIVDYESGMVTFHQSHSGKQLNFSYKGTGQSFTPANRIYTKREGQTVVETLEEITTRTEEQADLVDQILQTGNVSSVNGKTGIVDGLAEKSEVDAMDNRLTSQLNEKGSLEDVQQAVSDSSEAKNKANESLVKSNNPLGSMQTNGTKIPLDMLGNDVIEAMTGNTEITNANGYFENNRGVEFPLQNVVFNGELHPFDNSVKNVILGANVIGAKKGKCYMIEYISNGRVSNGRETYGIQISEYEFSGNIDINTRRLLIDYRDGDYEAQALGVISRVISLPDEELVFNIVYDNSLITEGGGLNISNTGLTGVAKGAIIHPHNYEYSINNFNKDRPKDGVDYDNLFIPGNYYTGSQPLVDASNGLAVKLPSSLLVIGGKDKFSTSQIQIPVTNTNQDFYYRTRITSTSWSSWINLRKEGAEEFDVYSGHSGVPNIARIEEFKQDYPLVSTEGKGAVMFRYDHGLTNFKQYIKPLHDAKGFPYCIAMNSRNWGLEENSGATQSEVKQWITGGLCEIWNHTATHLDTDTKDGLFDTIVNGKKELEDQLDVKVHGFIIPGMSPTGMGGLTNGRSLDVFSETYAGSLIMAYHAVSSGAFPGTARRELDGIVKQGQNHYTFEKRTVQEVKAQIDLAISEKTALQLMAHPRELNKGGEYYSTSDVAEILDYVEQKVNAGELVVLSPYQSLHATI